MKRRTFSILLFLLIILIPILFGYYIFNRTLLRSRISFNYLDGNISCPKNMDLNNDSKIDNNDLTYLQSFVNNIENQNLEVDLNGDKIVDELDLNIYSTCFSKFDFNSDNTIDCVDFNNMSDYINKAMDDSSNNNMIYDINNDSVLNEIDTVRFLNILSESGINKCYDLFYDNIFILNDDNLVVDSNKKIISRINPGIKASDFLDKFIADGFQMYMLDSIDTLKNDFEVLKTGDKIVFKSSNEEVIYTISVLGDVLGTGVITNDSAKKIARHVVDKDIFVTENSAVILSADYNNDGVIKMNDVMLLVKSIGNIE